jgi:tocopherol cyclase
MSRPYSAYRRAGADLPFGDPRRPHGVAMEGWFWRITDVERGVVVVVLCAVSRRADGRTWGTLGLAVHPDEVDRTAAVEQASTGPGGLVRIGDVLEADGNHVRAHLEDLAVEVELGVGRRWPPRWAFGALGPAQAIPGLSQYWAPWLLTAPVRGRVVLGGRELTLDGATAYAEKNWSPRAGFPERWWWGQAHGFDREDACVAFAGGVVGIGPARLTATSLVVALGSDVLRIVRPLQPLRVEVGESGWRLRGRTVRGHVVKVEGEAAGSFAHLLPVPLPEEGRHHPQAATQHLAARLHLSVSRRGRKLYEGESALAGLEQGRGHP